MVDDERQHLVIEACNPEVLARIAQVVGEAIT
jgi:hypothetical protein